MNQLAKSFRTWFTCPDNQGADPVKLRTNGTDGSKLCAVAGARLSRQTAPLGVELVSDCSIASMHLDLILPCFHCVCTAGISRVLSLHVQDTLVFKWFLCLLNFPSKLFFVGRSYR